MQREALQRKKIRTMCAVALCLSTVAAPGWAAGPNDQIYHFVDEGGVPHFTNVPVDPRYQPLQSTAWNPIAGRTFQARAQALPSQPLAQTPDDLMEARAADEVVSPSDR